MVGAGAVKPHLVTSMSLSNKLQLVRLSHVNHGCQASDHFIPIYEGVACIRRLILMVIPGFELVRNTRLFRCSNPLHDDICAFFR